MLINLPATDKHLQQLQKTQEEDDTEISFVNRVGQVNYLTHVLQNCLFKMD